MSRALALVDSSGESPTRSKLADHASVLLETKLYVPQSRAELVPRPRLLEALRQGLTRKLTLVIAPAGFGKTTLLADWLSASAFSARATGWVSLDASDSDPSLFWAYFAKALHRIHPGVGERAIATLQSSHGSPVEPVLAMLINEIDAVDCDFTIVFDDYHVIDSESVHDAMRFLLDHMPRRLRLVIASRAEPPLALARLRARGELSELRVADMRFNLDEATAFLHDVMALKTSTQETATLEQRTEGWITGLKFAALSMKHRNDVRGFVDAFSGDNRYIADYLVEEVLESEGEHVRRFLLATSFLDRLSGSLCDAVTVGADSQALLDELERRNLFVVALDDNREWFRYHHLFAEVLQKQAARSDPAIAGASHSRASLWYEKQGLLADATRQALSANDMARAAALLERTWPPNDRSYVSRQWLERVKTLPDSEIECRPVLCMAYAWGLLNGGELEAVEPRLRVVEEWLKKIDHRSDREEVAAMQMIVADHERFRTLRSEFESARVYLAQALGVIPGTLEHAKRALALIPEHDTVGRATGIALLALAHWGCGDLDNAHRTFSDALLAMRRNGHVHSEVRGIFVLGDIRAAQGRLREAARNYEGGLAYSAAQVLEAPPEIDELYLGLAEVHREWNELGSATQYLEAMIQSGSLSAHVGNKWRWCSAMAAIHVARGEYEEALELLTEAERSERRDPLPRTHPLDAMKARIHIVQGRLHDVDAWISKRNLRVHDELTFLREYEHITLARALIARSGTSGSEQQLHDALRLLDQLKTAAHAGGRRGSCIEILVLQSIAQCRLGALRGALDVLAEALDLGQPEGFLRVFLDEGTPMRDLLRHAIARGLAGEDTRRVLSAFDKPLHDVAPVSTANAPALTQALTTRELEILRLISTGMRNLEIADHLEISAATVKRHIANAYGKLGAGHRTEALLRATELKLL